MSFQTKTVMEQRLELVRLASQPGANISCLCRRYSVTRRTCYKWMQRFNEGGYASLADQSRTPHSSSNRTSKKVEEKIIALRMQNPEWGARKLQVILKRKRLADPPPATSTITAILHRHNLISEEKTTQHTPIKRFEYEAPNELWQMDFKGQFKLLNNSWCFPLTMLDDHSRFNLCLTACANQKSGTVKDQLTKVFRNYGLPDKILADNGSPWGTAGNLNSEGELPLSQLATWLMRLNVRIIHGRPYHPQTQGKEERFHRTMKTELLQYHQFNDLLHSQSGFDWWRNLYNLERPHESIGLKTPAEVYTHSKRSFPEILPAIEYPSTDEVRKVNEKGFIQYKGKEIKIGKGLTGQPVALRQVEDRKKEIYYCNQRIKDIIW
jgi:transposase InsO family protein